ncbi:MAG: class I SAM-dependent methyltransferase [Acidimicrobiia bacterium]
MVTALVHDRSGTRLDLPATRWFGSLTPEEHRLLDEVAPPVLDVGCGPGRHVGALAARGVLALGIDIADDLLDNARRRSVPVLRRSVFDRVPGAGRWGTALLLDGNLGLGGDPVTLLRRLGTLLRDDGRVLVEADEHGGPSADVRLEIDGRPGPWFELGRVGHRSLPAVAATAGFHVAGTRTEGGRWFARLERQP